MLYNADGLRVKKEDSSETIKSIWDGQNVLTETNASDVTQAIYTQSANLYGNLLSQRRGSTSHFALKDALGSVTGLANSAETVSDSYLYKAYGEILSSSGSTANPFKWVGGTGYQFDAALQQYYVRARHYDPMTARWMSGDPLGIDASRNKYEYVMSRPTVGTDPSGLLWPGVTGCLAGAGIGIIVGLIARPDDTFFGSSGILVASAVFRLGLLSENAPHEQTH